VEMKVAERIVEKAILCASHAFHDVHKNCCFCRSHCMLLPKKDWVYIALTITFLDIPTKCMVCDPLSLTH
jgi:hypothetical protein